MHAIVRVLAIAVVLLLGLSGSISAATREKYCSDGLVRYLKSSDTVVTIQFAPDIPIPGSAAFASQHAELADNYPGWSLSDNVKVFGIAQGWDVDSALTELRDDLQVGIASPVFEGSGTGRAFMTDAVLVAFKPSVSAKSIDSLNATMPISSATPNPDDPLHWTVIIAPGLGVDALSVGNQYYLSGLCRFAQPDFVYQPQWNTAPNDSLYYAQWHWDNSQQYGGKPDADIDADSAWLVTMLPTAAPIRIAVLDWSFDLGHPDLTTVGYIKPYDVIGENWQHPHPDTFPHMPNCTDATEPPRLFRRLFSLSQATWACAS